MTGSFAIDTKHRIDVTIAGGTEDMESNAVNVVLALIAVLLFLQQQVSGCGGGGGGGGGGDEGGCTPRNCKVSEWSSWRACSHDCGTTGVQTRTRYKTETESSCGTCPQLEESRPCNRDECQNGGTPIVGECSCMPGWTGTCCESGK